MDLIPLPYKIGILAVLAALLSVTAYVKGRNSLKADMQALRQSYELAAAQAAGREAERVRGWQQALIVSMEKWNVANKTIVADRDAATRSLRDAGDRARVRIAASPVARDCSISGPGYEDLQRKGEELEELVSAGARLGNSLAACLAQFPR